MLEILLNMFMELLLTEVPIIDGLICPTESRLCKFSNSQAVKEMRRSFLETSRKISAAHNVTASIPTFSRKIFFCLPKVPQTGSHEIPSKPRM